eukprot:jgi/Hompol1/6749/HPOL_001193-RA
MPAATEAVAVAAAAGTAAAAAAGGTDHRTQRETQISFFRDVLATLAELSPLGTLYAAAEADRIALWLYDHMLEASELAAEQSAGDADAALDPVAAVPAPFPSAASGPAERMSFLLATLAALDPNEELRPWLLDHPAEPGEDPDDSLPEMLRGRRLGNSRAAFFRVMAQVAFALGTTLSSAGNKRHGHHMMVCATRIYELVARAGPRTRVDKAADAKANLVFYREVAQLASAMGQNDQAVEYATRLVAFHEIAVAESLGEDGADVQDSSAASTKPQIDLAGHFAAQMLLADVAVKAKIFSTAVHAYTRALQLFDLQDALLVDVDTESANTNASANVNAERLEAMRQRKRFKKEICLKLVDANEEAKGDGLISITYARMACELGTSEAGSDSGVSTNEDDVKLIFRTGLLAYKYALQLAGGIEHASSPPIAVMASASDKKAPPIRTLLDESIQFLEDARGGATSDLTDPNSKRSISLQLAIVYTDIREEEKAQQLLKEYSLFNSSLTELDHHRRRSRSKGEGYSPSLIAPFANVIYSQEVFKRLTVLAPAMDAGSPLSRMTLSRGRRSATRGDIVVASKMQCTYCLMTFASDDPIMCEDCAAQRVFVYYCTEDCKQEHRTQHEPDCCKNKPASASNDFNLASTFNSLLASSSNSSS